MKKLFRSFGNISPIKNRLLPIYVKIFFELRGEYIIFVRVVIWCTFHVSRDAYIGYMVTSPPLSNSPHMRANKLGPNSFDFPFFGGYTLKLLPMA
jgi:hypothetical protein